MLLSTINKQLAYKISVLRRLKIGGTLQFLGASILLIAGLVNHVPLWGVFIGMFLAVSGIGFTGPNAMALPMSEQGARAGTASAIMGSMQFACGLLGGVILNFLMWHALLNMGLIMLLFVSVSLVCIHQLTKQMQHKQPI